MYLMGIDLTERMQALYDALGEAGLLEQVKVRFYPAAEYPGYSYLKIYERSASREAMLERLKQDLGMERSVVLTTQEGCGDVVIRGGANQAVKRLGRLFEPISGSRNNTDGAAAPSVFCIRKENRSRDLTSVEACV